MYKPTTTCGVYIPDLNLLGKPSEAWEVHHQVDKSYHSRYIWRATDARRDVARMQLIISTFWLRETHNMTGARPEAREGQGLSDQIRGLESCGARKVMMEEGEIIK
ncbi:hypothetical protein RRG08_059527 [Elysia crispata]|uniref:Uncharacterized protein n=1 Tax=Elysia crispata TaxID=231223 RepID=A0AAE1DD95_9GAST|nr:hypothetical protein RRG08_059527 [Elysia crispata]